MTLARGRGRRPRSRRSRSTSPSSRADDEALLRGGAAFETLRVYGGRPFLLDRHLDRLARSAAALALPPRRRRGASWSSSSSAAAPPDHVLRAVPRPSARSSQPARRCRPASTSCARAGSTLAIGRRRARRRLLAGVKSTSYAEAFAARRVPARRRRRAASSTGAVVRECADREHLVAARRAALHARARPGRAAGRDAWRSLLELAPATPKGSFALDDLAPPTRRSRPRRSAR